MSALMVMLTVSGCSRLQEKQASLDRDNWSVEQVYQEAKTSLNESKWDEAITQFQNLRARYPYGRYSEQAQVELGYAQFKAGEAELATATLDRFLESHPTHDLADYAYYLRGLAAYNEDNTLFGRISGRTDLSDRDPAAARRAIQSFETLTERFPDSRYAKDANRRIIYIASALAQHELHVAHYYLKREAYVAVLNRAKNIVERYDRTPVIEDALGIMAAAYLELGMDKLAEDTLRVLSLNFPDSPHLETASEANPASKFQPIAGASVESPDTKPGFFDSLLKKRRGANKS